MTRVLLIGYAPDTVDYSDPALPPGMNAEKIAAGIEAGLERMREQGWEAEFCAIRPDAQIRDTVSRQLSAARYDCVVVGGGVRLATGKLNFFEAAINAIRDGAPETPIAFNMTPEDTADAAMRWLKR